MDADEFLYRNVDLLLIFHSLFVHTRIGAEHTPQFYGYEFEKQFDSPDFVGRFSGERGREASRRCRHIKGGCICRHFLHGLCSFPYANVITLCQMISSSCFLYALRRLKFITFSTNESTALTDSSRTLVSIKALISTSPLSLTYLVYMLASMESIRGVNVPMYTTLRRTTVVFTMLIEYIIVGQRYSQPILGSVALILLGAFIAGARDLSFDSYGYIVVFISNITTAIYLTTIARIGKSSGLNSFGLMWCNGILCAPILFVWTFVRGDLEMTMNFPNLLSPGFLVVLLLSCILAFFLNYTIFLNTTLNSALTQTICGNLKDFFTISLGWLIFGGLPFDLLNVVGQLVGFLGSGMYAYYKLFGK